MKSTEAEVVFLEELVAVIAEKWYFITVVCSVEFRLQSPRYDCDM